ncbi:MAG: hypothetical protein ACLTSS_06985 [Phocaeicola coprocola]
MRKFIFILLSIVALVSCHTGEQDGDVLLNKNIKVFRYDRLQFEATAMNSFSALQKMSLDCPRATKILIEDVLMLGTVDEPAINERLCEYYSDTILLRGWWQDATGEVQRYDYAEEDFIRRIFTVCGKRYLHFPYRQSTRKSQHSTSR